MYLHKGSVRLSISACHRQSCQSIDYSINSVSRLLHRGAGPAVASGTSPEPVCVCWLELANWWTGVC